jgi:hypothetical protein
MGPRFFPVPNMSSREQAIYISKCFLGCTLCILLHFFLGSLPKEEKSEKELWYDALEYQDDDLPEKKVWPNALKFQDAKLKQVHDIYIDGKLAWIDVPIKRSEILHLPELENGRKNRFEREDLHRRGDRAIIKLVEGVEKTNFDASSSFLPL